MSENKRKKVVEDVISIYLTGDSLQKAIETLQSIQQANQGKYHKLWLESVCYECGAPTGVMGERFENDEEYKKRIEKEKAKQDKKDGLDYQLFLNLKARFEP